LFVGTKVFQSLTGRGDGLGGTEVEPRQQIEMTMKRFYFGVKSGTYRLNFGIENDASHPKNTYFFRLLLLNSNEIAWSDRKRRFIRNLL
jgi:hypothetical protein